jgi:hypothetical protein
MGSGWRIERAGNERDRVELRELTANDWVRLSELIAHLWVMTAVMVATGLTYMLAHAMIPSLVLTGDIPVDQGRRVRAPLYAMFALGLAGIVTIVVKATLLALDLLPQLLPRLAI